jgi:2-polyprenyl-3-methyl-5-hydroxy-6-metoxy-1,4-benzoquinol methylase
MVRKVRAVGHAIRKGILTMSRACIVCGDSHSSIVFEEFGIGVLKCRACGHVYSSYEQDQHYDDYFGERVPSGEQFWWDKAHAKMYADFCDRFIVGKAGSLLDVGCGLGFFVKTVSSFPAWQVFGCDTSKGAVEFARRELGLDNVYWGPAEECGFREDYFDIVTLWDVIEHVPDPDPLLSFLSKVLREDGFLFIHTPNIRIQLPKARMIRLIKGMNPHLHYLEAKDHINIYSMHTIKRVLRRNGYSNIQFTHLHPIQSLSGSRNPLLALMKNALFYSSKVLFSVSAGKLNFDNLFVTARK